ncbi:hypothetical protein VTL71DRAFT_12906, partial [Oculimacula yallundae]
MLTDAHGFPPRLYQGSWIINALQGPAHTRLACSTHPKNGSFLIMSTHTCLLWPRPSNCTQSQVHVMPTLACDPQLHASDAAFQDINMSETRA